MGACFYTPPKTHKNVNNPPGWPIVSGNCCITEKASRYVDSILRPFVVMIPPYLYNTMHLLQILEGICIPSTYWLVTIDIEALYCSIPHDRVVVAWSFLSQKSPQDREHDKFVIDLLDFNLKNNVFRFAASLYLQVQGMVFVPHLGRMPVSFG